MELSHTITPRSISSRRTTGDVDADIHCARQQLQETFQHYVAQLLNGCGSPECSEVLCYTGSRNVIKRPQRQYNPGTARQIALAMCATQDNKKHLCSYLPLNAEITKVGHPASVRDPSSLSQRLSGTKSIRSLLWETPAVGLDAELVQLHQRLSRVLKAVDCMPRQNEPFLSNKALAGELLPCFQWLLKKLPLQRTGPWMMINRDIVSKGYAYPSKRENMPADGRYNRWLVILDGLEHEPSLRLLERTMLVIGRRDSLEHSLSQADTESVHDLGNFRKSVECRLAQCLQSAYASSELFAIVIWLKKLFTKLWDSRAEIDRGSACSGVLQTIKAMLECACDHHDWPEDTFSMPMVPSRLDTLDSASSFMNTGSCGNTRHIFSWPFVFSQRALSVAFRAINHLTMSQANSNVEKASALRRKCEMYQYIPEDKIPRQIQHAEEHYLLLSVSRGNILSDTFNQLWQRRRYELRRPLRVRLGEIDELEIGHDLGGVQIEYFNLVCKDAFAAEAGLFTTDQLTGCSYFRTGSLQPLHMFELLGMLIALALYNGITLPVSLPRIFYRHLLHPRALGEQHPDIDDIRDAFPDHARSLTNMLNEDVYGLEFTYPLEANGIRLTVQAIHKSRHLKHGKTMTVTSASATEIGRGGEPDISMSSIRTSWPGWEIVKANVDQPVEDVTPANRENYVSNFVDFLAYGSVAPQVDAFLKGFFGAELFGGSRALSLLSIEQLKAHLEGANHLDINDLRETTTYDGYEVKSRYIQNFWKIVFAWPQAKQKQLLKFVTAAERIPISGAKHLTFIIKKTTPENIESLPTSSTCFGMLMLPRYPTAAMLEAKLSLALKYGSEGFGNG